MDRAGFRPVVLLPTFNNADALPHVLDEIARRSWPMLVVDDGSTDTTASVLEKFQRDQPTATLHRLSHPTNRGKGRALRSGFAEARRRGYTHALTMDTDGQHVAEDAAKLLDAAAENPTALVTGWRDAADPHYPGKSRWGRRFSNFAILLCSGRRVIDSQCGLRVYPLGLVEAVDVRAGRYGYEAEVLTRSGWAGCPLVQVPTRTIYLPRDRRVSHFRPVRDSLHGLRLHLRLLLRALWPWPYKKWPNSEAAGSSEAQRPLWRRMLAWFDPRVLVAMARRDRMSQVRVAAGLGVGGLVANLPVYPVQTLVAVYLAKRLHLHPVSTVLGSQIATPPINVALIFAAIYLGRRLTSGHPPAFADFTAIDWSSFAAIHDLLRSYFFAWWIGGTILGVLIGLVMFGLAWAALRWVPVKEDRPADSQVVQTSASSTGR